MWNSNLDQRDAVSRDEIYEGYRVEYSLSVENLPPCRAEMVVPFIFAGQLTGPSII